MRKGKEIQGMDLFCGAGGMSQGMLMAANGLKRKLTLTVINHWRVAIDTHKANHAYAKHLCTGLENVMDPRELVPGGYLDVLSASPECTHHSNARGGKPRNDQSRHSAFHVLRFLEAIYTNVLVLENVWEFTTWGPLGRNGRPLKSKRGKLFEAFVSHLRVLGYTNIEWRKVCCADYGDPTTRTRLVLIARRDGKAIHWPAPTHFEVSSVAARRWVTARAVIDLCDKGEDITLRKKPLAAATRRRIAIGIRRFCKVDPEPFLVILRGTGTARSIDRPMPTVTAGGTHLALVQVEFLVQYYCSSSVASLDDPLPTVTTKDRFALVQLDGRTMRIYFRMLRNKELAAASGFPLGYKFTGTKTQVTKQIGNAVPPGMAKAIFASVLRGVAA